MGRQVADGLAAAHAAGVVHRDVKPGNVLIADDGRVKLTDFGVSRAVDDVQLTRTGLIAGTPAFMSPEVARGQDPTPASDVFALGATLYAAVEGQPPFGLDDNAYALLHKVATGVVDPPQRAGPLTALLMRLLAADPDDRPTAAQARDALGGIAEGRNGAGTTAVLGAGSAAAVDRTAVVGGAAGAQRGDGPVATTAAFPPAPPARPRGDAGDGAEPPSGPRSRRPLLLASWRLLVVGGRNPGRRADDRRRQYGHVRPGHDHEHRGAGRAGGADDGGSGHHHVAVADHRRHHDGAHHHVGDHDDHR